METKISDFVTAGPESTDIGSKKKQLFPLVKDKSSHRKTPPEENETKLFHLGWPSGLSGPPNAQLCFFPFLCLSEKKYMQHPVEDFAFHSAPETEWGSDFELGSEEVLELAALRIDGF